MTLDAWLQSGSEGLLKPLFLHAGEALPHVETLFVIVKFVKSFFRVSQRPDLGRP
jgi:hypothetical protein